MNTESPRVREVKCPVCGALVRWEPASRWRPFCSERCRTQDLGAWASESYRIPEAEAADGATDDADLA
ncbi:MAG: DNA gyrase inhibitor YacG [Rhodocyclaceae bacterium]|nr:DNA gyrase inhibitor YacG [Rhodocyclaceae bacterium]